MYGLKLLKTFQILELKLYLSKLFPSVISGSHSSKNVDSNLLGCNAEKFYRWLSMFQKNAGNNPQD